MISRITTFLEIPVAVSFPWYCMILDPFLYTRSSPHCTLLHSVRHSILNCGIPYLETTKQDVSGHSCFSNALFSSLLNHATHIPPTLSISPALHISSPFRREMDKNLQENNWPSFLEIWFSFGFLTKQFFQHFYSFLFSIAYTHLISTGPLNIRGHDTLEPSSHYILSCTELIHSYHFICYLNGGFS